MNDYYSVLVSLVYESVKTNFYPQLIGVALKLPFDSIYPIEYKQELYSILPDYLAEYSKIVNLRFIHEIILI